MLLFPRTKTWENPGLLAEVGGRANTRRISLETFFFFWMASTCSWLDSRQQVMLHMQLEFPHGYQYFLITIASRNHSAESTAHTTTLITSYKQQKEDIFLLILNYE